MPSKSNKIAIPQIFTNSKMFSIVITLLFIGLLVYVLLHWNKSTESFYAAPPLVAESSRFIVIDNQSNSTITASNSFNALTSDTTVKKIPNSVTITKGSQARLPVCLSSTCKIHIENESLDNTNNNVDILVSQLANKGMIIYTGKDPKYTLW